MTEQLAYDVIRSYPDFEVRRYADYDLVQVEQRGDYTQAGYRGFNPLFQFITGSNASGEKIAMTAPVIQHELGSNLYAVAFAMPRAVAGDRIPRPTDANLSVIHVPQHDVAVMRFRGLWSEEKFRDVAEKLKAAVNRESLSARGEVYSARYDPPWKPGFMRRNEALIDLT